MEQEYSEKIKIKVHFMENKGYAAACNYGYKHPESSNVYIFSNPDIIFNSDIIERIKAEFDENTYGTVIQKNRYLKNCTFNLYPQFRNIFTEILFIHKFLNRLDYYNPRFISISGAFMIFGKKVLRGNGLFDENYFLYYEEDDYYYRLRLNRNFKIIKDKYIIHNIASSVEKNVAMNRFMVQMDSLYYYSKKFDDFRYLKNLIMLFKISSHFIQSHKEKLTYLLSRMKG